MTNSLFPDFTKNYFKTFLFQEQLAFVLEMLSLYEEALVQYDELDALFSQFVLNSNITKSPKWLDSFKQPITSWQAPRLTTLVPHQLRDQIIKKKATLLEFRSYLFQRQCAMLLLTCKPWEVRHLYFYLYTSSGFTKIFNLRVILVIVSKSFVISSWYLINLSNYLYPCSGK